MVEHASKHPVHIAVWRFFRAAYTGKLENLLDHPIYTNNGSTRYVPAFTVDQIEKLSGESERVVTDTLATLVYEEVLVRKNKPTGYTAAGEPLRWYNRHHYSHPHFETLWVPALLPQSPEIIEDWPLRKRYESDPFSRVVDVAVSNSEALEIMDEINQMQISREEFDAIMRSVNEDGISLRAAVERAKSMNK